MRVVKILYLHEVHFSHLRLSVLLRFNDFGEKSGPVHFSLSMYWLHLCLIRAEKDNY